MPSPRPIWAAVSATTPSTVAGQTKRPRQSHAIVPAAEHKDISCKGIAAKTFLNQQRQKEYLKIEWVVTSHN